MKLDRIRSSALSKHTAGLLLLLLLAATVGLLSGSPDRALAQPANDAFADAEAIPIVPFTSTQNNVGATTETGEPAPCGPMEATSWFSFTPSLDMQVTADTFGSDYDTVLAVYTGNAVDNLINLDCNNDFLGQQSEVSFLARAAVTYYIQAGGKTVLAGSLTLNVTGVAQAGVPSLVNFQGRLTNSRTGRPVRDDDYSIVFRIYGALTGGTDLWSEAQKVAVSGGLFSVLLGSTTPLTADIFAGEARFLELQVEPDPPVTPRQRLVSVPYALHAEQLTGPTGATIAWNGLGNLGFPERFAVSSDLSVGGNLRVGSNLTAQGVIAQFGNDFFLNQDGPDSTSHIYFWADGSNIGQHLAWEEANDRFHFSDDLSVLGSVAAVGPLTVTGNTAFATNGAAWFMNADGGDQDQYIYFYNGGSPTGVYIAWSEFNNSFVTNATLKIFGNFAVAGTKNAIVDTSQGSRLTTAVESPGVWFEDFGSAQLKNGSAAVSLDPLFGETVNTEVDYHVFLTPLGESAGLYVADKRSDAFEVRAADGSADVAFDCRIVAKRRGYEDDRLELSATAGQPRVAGAAAAEAMGGSGGGPPSAERAVAADGGGGGVPWLFIVLPLSAVFLAVLGAVVGRKALRMVRG